MTQDAPLDQSALEAVARIIWADFAARYSGGDFPGLDSDLVAAQQVAATSRAILNALSRRVPASGGEYVPCIIRNDSAGFYEFVTEDVPALYGGMMAANVERIGKLQGGDLIGFRIYDETAPASPIEGWRTVPVDDDSRDFANSALPIEMIHAGMDALEKVDEDNRNYVAGETIDWDNGMVAVAVYRAMLAAAPSIPEGVAAPEGLTPEKYAEQLAVSLREKHYPEVPQFEPMTGDVMGLLSQIDNMVAGLVRATAPEGKAEGGADRRPANCRNRLHDEGKAHPKSGCAVCKTGGITGCPYERPIPEGKAEPGEAAVIVTESMVEAFMAEFQRQGIAMDDFSPPIYPARLIEAALSALGEQP